jgi:hypothetical protein
MKKLTLILSLSLAICLSPVLHAQATWYFGNGGGLKFTGGVPAPFAQPAGTMSGAGASGEGSSMLMDAAGNVIMFTNGRTIWNGNGVAQGSPAYQLAGSSSSTQTALIVPVPGSSTGATVEKAFIFTVNCAETTYGNSTNLYGLRVSLATITGNATIGYTITIAPADLNVLLTPVNYLMSERLAVTNFVVDNTGQGGYWVMTHGVGAFYGVPTSCINHPACTMSNGVVDNTNIFQPGDRSFFAYHVTCATTTISALDLTEKESIISPTGGISPHWSWNHPGGNSIDLSGNAQINGQSQIKFNSAATKIAVALPWNGSLSGTTGIMPNPACQLFDFDINTGYAGASHQIQFSLGFDHTDSNNKDGMAYGLEFSPNGNYLYVSSSYLSNVLAATTSNGITTRIYRYDISTWTPGAATVVPGSAYLDIYNNLGSYAAMQLGPDNKIYIAKQNTASLAVIGDPNNTAIASCDFHNNYIPISGICNSGLPTTVLTSNTPTVPVINSVSNCSGSNITALGGYTGEPISSYTWEIYASNASGSPVNVSGGVVSPNSAAWFYYSQTNSGTSPGLFSFPGTSSLPCNKYYTVRLILSHGCGDMIPVQQTILLNCTPTPIITGPTTLCYGTTSATLCTNYSPTGGRGTNVAWLTPTATSPQCITVTPAGPTTYQVWVTQNGCTGTATTTVTPLPNYTNFSLSSSQVPVTSPYYTAYATPTIDPGTVTEPGFGWYWEVSEIDLSTGAIIPNSTVYNPNCWWLPTTVNNFVGYDNAATVYNNTPFTGNNTGTAFNGPAGSCTNPTVGHFKSGHKYRVTYATWSNACPWTQITATMYMCGGCRMANGSSAEVEYSALSYENTTLYGAAFKETMQKNELSIYPNPSNGIFTMNFSGENSRDVVVYDLMGNVVFEKNNTTDAMVTLDLSTNANGIYLVKVVSNGEIISKRIIKQ